MDFEKTTRSGFAGGFEERKSSRERVSARRASRRGRGVEVSAGEAAAAVARARVEDGIRRCRRSISIAWDGGE